jgi:membrane-associated phospholipid phosphatase
MGSSASVEGNKGSITAPTKWWTCNLNTRTGSPSGHRRSVYNLRERRVMILLGVLLAMVHTDSGLARYDLTAARWGVAQATSSSSRVLRDINWFGSTELTVSLAGIVAAIEYRRSRSLAAIWFLAIVIVGQLIVVNITRGIVDRAGPDIDRLSGFAGASFPSGHAASAAATFAATALLLGRRRRRYVKAILTGAAGGIAVVVAETRVSACIG